MIEFLWYDLLYEPLYNVLIFLYSISPGRDMGIAVIMLTVLIRIVLLPLSIRGNRSEQKLEKLKPLIEEIKYRYRHDLDKQREAIRRMLSKNNISVFGNTMSLLLQLAFILVLYEIFSSGLQPFGHNVIYPFNRDPGIIDPNFLGRINMVVPNLWLSIIAAVVVLFGQAMRMRGKWAEATVTERILTIGIPIGIFFATVIIPSAKALFIITSSVFSQILRGISWLLLKYVVKEEGRLKQTIEDIWTN